MQNNNELINLINIQFNEINIQIECEIAKNIEDELNYLLAIIHKNE